MTLDRSALAGRLGYQFHDPELLDRALRHRSWCSEHPGHESNERLEFLGDAVLGWVVADLAYAQHPLLSEGGLTDLRKSVVNANALARRATELGIGDELMLGKGEAAAGGRVEVVDPVRRVGSVDRRGARRRWLRGVVLVRRRVGR